MALVFQEYVDRGKSTPTGLVALFLRVLPSYNECQYGKWKTKGIVLNCLHFRLDHCVCQFQLSFRHLNHFFYQTSADLILYLHNSRVCELALSN